MRCLFPIRAIQIDGGSEFKGGFEQACQAARIALHVLPPKRPQGNGGLERANGIRRYEFHASYPLPTTIRELRPLVQWWEQVYNLLRPHQALNQKTPAEHLQAAGVEAPDVSVSQMCVEPGQGIDRLKRLDYDTRLLRGGGEPACSFPGP